MNPDAPYPVQYSVDYPDRPLNRLTNRVIAYAHVLVTDRYPPFRLVP